MYVVIEMQNGYVEGRAWPYENRDDAEVKMFQVLSEAVKSPVAVHSVILVGDDGFLLERRCYKHPSDPTTDVPDVPAEVSGE